jgi:hypothetical protein
MNKNTKTTKTTKGTSEKPNASKEESEDFIGAASSWCAERGVPTRVMPEHSMRLIESAGLLDHAIEEAGGPTKVPEAVLLYRQLLHDTALAAALHGMKRAILGLYGGAGR